ncbi:sterol carrier protein domain-containing protein (plasmid) [Streptomyces sp. NBC_01166]|uniref:sterol carrier protein domain-containing protein n=1 Tax=Streptomyces sp. NBC_01166 TaxID=2903755 RepID=UPI00386CEEAE|nr:sterol carrier protein domain-containing protein [Streptomyces sp. NBC_01166]
MLRILDLQEAVRLRGWPTSLSTTVPVTVEGEEAGSWQEYLLSVHDGTAQINRAHTAGEVRLTRRQLAVWYAGGYPSTASARLAGVTATSEEALSKLIQITTGHEPWLPDHF